MRPKSGCATRATFTARGCASAATSPPPKNTRRPAQRLFNLLCIAYGFDKVLFADAVEQRWLPKERAESCADEYRQVDFAYRTLIAPHVDSP